jgi:hypothetical protein
VSAEAFEYFGRSGFECNIRDIVGNEEGIEEASDEIEDIEGEENEDPDPVAGDGCIVALVTGVEDSSASQREQLTAQALLSGSVALLKIACIA